ncbi:TonB family protein [Methylotuvimicrobium sp.]|uniref:energy transducer TonB n=1 Tax=Methylotuvimicrobium sp. TaxID=2822413 RepID=UPI003D65EE92
MTTSRAFLGGVSNTSENDALMITLFIAAILHIMVILGINFSMPKQEETHRAIEITLATTPAHKAPKKASFLAQENQIGAGKQKTKPTPPKQKLPSRGTLPNKQPQSKPVQRQAAAPKKIISTIRPAETKAPPVPVKAPVQPQSKPVPKITAAALQQQIAQLGTEVRQQQLSADISKIKHVNAVSTHKYVASQYEMDWKKKVEATGNLNYPEVARKKNFFGTLTMEVGINPDGTIYNIRIKRPSGNAALDEAAKRIVRLSAPFPPLPQELLKELDVLVITRVWKFSDESGMSAR